MHRFFSSFSNISEDKIIIADKEQVHHIKDVLRLRTSDCVVIFDERGNEYNCVIARISSRILLNIQTRRAAFRPQKGPRITIACAIPKKSRFDDIVDKLTQLGVDKIIPLDTERVVVKLDKHKKLSRQKRWEKIALSAAQQSHRAMLPVIEPIKNIREVLSESQGFDLKLIPALIDERKSLKEIFARSQARNILVLIGPEGDFTPREVALAKEAGCIPVTLGDSVLRVETAAVVAAAFIRLYADS